MVWHWVKHAIEAFFVLMGVFGVVYAATAAWYCARNDFKRK